MRSDRDRVSIDRLCVAHLKSPKRVIIKTSFALRSFLSIYDDIFEEQLSLLICLITGDLTSTIAPH